jgi:sugar transferase (PEP-CTERM/EpsH1 system associated)
MRILFLSPYPPSLIRVRPFNWIKHLAARGHQITLLTLVGSAQETRDLQEVARYCHRVENVPFPRWRPPWNLLTALPQPSLPLQAAYTRSPAMKQRIRETLQRESFDVVHIEHLRGSTYADAVNGVPTVWDSVDCISLLFERTLKNGPTLTSRLMARVDLGRTRRYEGRHVEQHAATLVTSPEDRDALEALVRRWGDPAAAEIVVLPNGVDLAYFAPLELPRQPDRIIFSGKMSYHANVAAALYLGQEIMPRVWGQRPDVRLQIVGKDPAPSVRALADDPRVMVTGYVPDMRPFLASATVAATPLRYAVGIQNKVLEAMAMGTPVVTTPQTRTALLARAGEHFFIGEDTDDFARQMLRLLNDHRLAARVGEAGRRYVAEHHDWNRLAAQLAKIYRRVAGHEIDNAPPPPQPFGQVS